MIFDANDAQSTGIPEILNNGDNSFAGSMFRLWKTEFPDVSDKFTEELCKSLEKTLNFKLQSNLQQWKNYLKEVKSCKFFNENPQFLNLKYILLEKTIEEVLAGGKGFSKWLLEKSGKLDARERENMFDAINHIKAIYSDKSESEICIKGRIRILQNLGPMKYHAWFYKIGLSYEEGSRLTCYGSNFMVNTTIQRYGDALNIDQYHDVDIEHFLDTSTDF